MSNNQLVINTHKLHKEFNDLPVLVDISISVKSGEFVSIMGRSGSGKSTLLSILGLLEPPTSGEYILCGHNIQSLDSYQLAIIRNKNIGWIFQTFNLLNDMTVLENILLPAKYSHNKLDLKIKALSLLTKVGLENKLNSYPSELSGGQQQRVAIARALIMEPDVLFCDEPTGNLDLQNSQIVASILCELNKEGTTIVLVTHDPELAAIGSKTFYISDGKI